MRLNFVAIITILICCSCKQSAKQWQKPAITSALGNVFPNAEISVTEKGIGLKNNDTFHMPKPEFAASVKLKNHEKDDFYFYFYNCSPLDTTLFIPVLKQVIVFDMASMLGSKKSDYVLLMPYFDSTRGNKMLVYGFNKSMSADSAALSRQHYQLLHLLGLKSRSMETHISQDMLNE